MSCCRTLGPWVRLGDVVTIVAIWAPSIRRRPNKTNGAISAPAGAVSNSSLYVAKTEGGRAKPLYYGMLTFASVARGALVRVRLEPSRAELSAFAVRVDRRWRVKVDPNGSFANATMLRLAGPRLVTNVTLGGGTVDENGNWEPVLDEARDLDGSEVVFEVAASSAAVITLVPKGRSPSGLKSEFRDVQ